MHAAKYVFINTSKKLVLTVAEQYYAKSASKYFVKTFTTFSKQILSKSQNNSNVFLHHQNYLNSLALTLQTCLIDFM